METTTLRIPAIHCSGCVRTIAGTLGRLPGVGLVDGDPHTKTVTVTFEPRVVDLARIEREIEETGFFVADVAGGTVASPSVVGHPAHEDRSGFRYPIVALVAGAALAIAGYLLGFLGYAYGVAVPGAFDRFSVVAVAAVSGVAAFFSPCVFPLLPGYALYQLGATASASLWSRARIAIAAAAGVTVVNLAIGVVIVLLGSATPFQPDPRQDIPLVLALRFLAGAGIVALGLAALRGRTLGHLIGRLADAISSGRSLRIEAGDGQGAVANSFAYGLTYNAAGIGCTGPILLSLVLYAVASGQAVLAFAVFGLTMAGLMFAVTAASTLVGGRGAATLAAGSERVQRIGALVLVAVGTFTMLSLSLGPGRELFVRTLLPFLP